MYDNPTKEFMGSSLCYQATETVNWHFFDETDQYCNKIFKIVFRKIRFHQKSELRKYKGIGVPQKYIMCWKTDMCVTPKESE